MKQSRLKLETPDIFSLESICHSGKLMKNLLDVIESHPSETAVKFGKSIFYFIAEDFDQTLGCLEFLTQEFPDIPLLHQRLAQVFIYKKNYEKAIIHLKKVLEINEDDLTAKIWLCISYLKIGESEKANTEADKLRSYIFHLAAKIDDLAGLQ